MLFVCTGNICRTPMATGIFNEVVRGRASARATSVGLLYDEEPASPNGVQALAERGIDISGHRSRIMRTDHLRDADLILGMARRHVREAVVLEPSIFPRTFTLKELVRLAEQSGPRMDEALGPWLTRVSKGRSTRDLLGDDRSDDVADPVGQPIGAYRRTAAELDELVRRLVDLLWPSERQVD